jgi:hypothetical protein
MILPVALFAKCANGLLGAAENLKGLMEFGCHLP